MNGHLHAVELPLASLRASLAAYNCLWSLLINLSSTRRRIVPRLGVATSWELRARLRASLSHAFAGPFAVSGLKQHWSSAHVFVDGASQSEQLTKFM